MNRDVQNQRQIVTLLTGIVQSQLRRRVWVLWPGSDVILGEESEKKNEDDLADENGHTKLHAAPTHSDASSVSVAVLCLPV